MKIAAVIPAFRNPGATQALLDNIEWAGRPDIPIYVFEDRSPLGDCESISALYRMVCKDRVDRFETSPNWGCIHGNVEFAMLRTDEDWIVYVPEDARFCKGGLRAEIDAVREYGLDWIGGIQVPYWNGTELRDKGIDFDEERPELPRNPHWESDDGKPRAYVNLNGAGCALSRRVFEGMGRAWPRWTWRFDEWFAYKAWLGGQVCIQVPGIPRLHQLGSSANLMPSDIMCPYASEESWKLATGGESVLESDGKIRDVMSKLPDWDWDSMYRYFNEGGKLV